MKRLLALLSAFLFSTLLIHSQDALPSRLTPTHPTVTPAAAPTLADLKRVEQKIQAAKERAVKATVAVLLGDGAASGVVVSADGLVLTAAHVALKPGRRMWLQFPDDKNAGKNAGRKVQAKALGVDHITDAAVLKILGDETWPFAEMGVTANLQLGDWCFGTGHPLRIEPDHQPVLRCGRVLFIGHGKNVEDGIYSDWTMIPGDSGGPLFDLEGKVIGIHSRIGNGITENHHVSIESFRGHWTDLLEGLKRGKTGGGEGEAPDVFGWMNKALESFGNLTSHPKITKLDLRMLGNLQSLVAKSTPSLVSIQANGKPAALGVVVRADGYILTKASELSGDLLCKIAKQDYPAKIVCRNEEYDLALLKISARRLTPLAFPDAEEPAVGTFLVTPNAGGNPVAIGVLGHSSRKSPPDHRINRAVMEVVLASSEDVAKIGSVVPDGPADKAGIKPGDVVVAINDHKIAQPNAMVRFLAQYKPGDQIKLHVKRADEELDFTVTLKSSPAPPVKSEFGTRPSQRHNDFPAVFTHDSVLSVAQCGGPIFNLNGQVVGLNIARENRTATLAIPARELKTLIANLLAQTKP